jgi:hypothetical protein
MFPLLAFLELTILPRLITCWLSIQPPFQKYEGYTRFLGNAFAIQIVAK